MTCTGGATSTSDSQTSTRTGRSSAGARRVLWSRSRVCDRRAWDLERAARLLRRPPEQDIFTSAYCAPLEAESPLLLPTLCLPCMAKVDTFGQPGSLLLPTNLDSNPNVSASETVADSFVSTGLLTTEGMGLEDVQPSIREKDTTEQVIEVDRPGVLGQSRIAFRTTFPH